MKRRGFLARLGALVAGAAIAPHVETPPEVFQPLAQSDAGGSLSYTFTITDPGYVGDWFANDGTGWAVTSTSA